MLHASVTDPNPSSSPHDNLLEHAREKTHIAAKPSLGKRLLCAYHTQGLTKSVCAQQHALDPSGVNTLAWGDSNTICVSLLELG